MRECARSASLATMSRSPRPKLWVVATQKVPAVNRYNGEESYVLLCVAKALKITRESGVGHETGSPADRRDVAVHDL